MSKIDIVRAWKDEEYRESLSDAERALLPEHPAGIIELPDADLEDVSGGYSTEQLETFGCCFGASFRWYCDLDTWGVRTWGCCTDIDYAL